MAQIQKIALLLAAAALLVLLSGCAPVAQEGGQMETTPGEVTAANVAQFIDDSTADNADDERLTFVASAEVRKALRDIRRPIVAI